MELAQPVITGLPMTPGRLAGLADLGGADNLAAEVEEARRQCLAAPGNPRHEIDRPVQELRYLVGCSPPGRTTAQPPQGTEKALRGLLVPGAHGIGWD